MAAFRRSIGGLGGVLQSLRRMALAEGAPALAAGPQRHAAFATLVSLRSFWPAAAQQSVASSSRAPAAELGCGARCFAAAAASPAVGQQAAAAAAAEEEESLEQVRARIFGTHIGNGLRSGRKVLRRPLIGSKLVAWYPEDPSKRDPLMINFKAESMKLKLDKLRRRGKAPPKKGAGKRAGKKK